MLSPHIYAAFAQERHQTFLAQAETDGRNRRARLQRRRDRATAAAAGRPVVLRDGSAVLIRPVRRADAPLLADGFTDVDHHDHEALGALDHADGRGVGIARYIRDAADPQAAEIAVTVIDDWQGRGLGTELMAQLSERARSEGIRRFTALVAADNPAMAGLLCHVRADLVRREPDALQYEITLGPAEEYTPAGAPSPNDGPLGKAADGPARP
jgi:GNAT superfamily N-acetyltransferase